MSTSTSRLEIRIRFCETDLMGVVHHANHLVYFEAGRVDWLRRRGISFADWNRQGIHMAVVDASVQYRAPILFDDVVVVETSLTSVRSYSVVFTYAMRRGDADLAEGTTRLACVDAHHKLCPIPPGVVEVLRSPELPGSPSGPPGT